MSKLTLVNTPQLRLPDLPRSHAYTLEPGRPTPGRHNLLRPPIASRIGAGILTRFPSTTALALVLGADSPCADARGAGNLGLTASRTFTCFIATHVSIRTSDTSSKGHPSPSTAYGTLSYRLRNSLKSPPPASRHPVPFGTGRVVDIRFRSEQATSSASGSVWNRPNHRHPVPFGTGRLDVGIALASAAPCGA